MPHAKITFPFWVPDATKLAKTLISILGVGPPPKGTTDLYFDEKRTEGAVLRPDGSQALSFKEQKT